MSTVELLLLVWALVFGINLAPGFAPPTWAVLAFFIVQFHLPVIPLALGAAVMASSGRLVLALASRRWGRRLLPDRRKENLDALGQWIQSRGGWAAPLAVLIYSFGPIPSNQLFIAVGLTGMRLTPVVAAFMAGRLVSYTVSGLIVHRAASSIEAALTSSWRGVVPVLLQLLAFAGLFLFTLIDWRRVLHLPAARPPGKSDHPVGPRDAA